MVFISIEDYLFIRRQCVLCYFCQHSPCMLMLISYYVTVHGLFVMVYCRSLLLYVTIHIFIYIFILYCVTLYFNLVLSYELFKI